MNNDGGPAFPVTDAEFQDGAVGMSLRDYFAAKAMHAVASSDAWAHRSGHAQIAESAYLLADAMLKAREVKP